jgi:cell division septation protein DedD
MAGREVRRTRTGGRGLVGALVSLSLLAAVAFLLGGLAGLVWKQPGLLLAHLTGETREVAWGVPSPQDVDVAAEQAAPPTPPSEVSRPAAPGAREAAPSSAAPATRAPAVAAAPPPALPAPSGRIAIQVGAFAERSSAERLRGELQQGGYPAYVAPGASSGTPRWRVRVGPYPSREDADRVAAQLKSARSLPTWVLDEDVQ